VDIAIFHFVFVDKSLNVIPAKLERLMFRNDRETEFRVHKIVEKMTFSKKAEQLAVKKKNP
jgi:hypothetical protein